MTKRFSAAPTALGPGLTDDEAQAIGRENAGWRMHDRLFYVLSEFNKIVILSGAPRRFIA